MNRDDITRMAREAGFVGFDGDNGSLRRFAALVAAHTLANIDPSSFTSYQEGYEAGRLAEREKVAKWQMGSGYSTGHGETIEDLLVELEWQVRESEREACAKVCEEPGWNAANWCATQIRARGQA